MSAECLLHDEVPDLDEKVLARFAALPTAAVSDAMQRTGGAVGVLPVPGGPPRARVAGRALTVRTRPGDNLVVHKAMDLARPGDVLVVDAGGHVDRAIVGGLLCGYALSRGVAAVVVDGAVRDVAELAATDLPVFARGVSHLGPYKNGPGAIRGPVSIGGTAVRHGDLVVADADGVAIVPRHRLTEVAAAAEKLTGNEERITEAIRAGRWDRRWVDEALHVTHVRRSEVDR